MNDTFTTRMLLTTAVFAAVAALLTGPAAAFVMDVEGGGSGAAAATPAPTVEPGTIPYLSHGVGVDESLFSGAVADDRLDPAIRTALAANEAANVATQAKTGPIPYLSQGIGVDQSLFQGEQSLGLTGDSALTRGDVFQANTAVAASGGDFDWTWVGYGAGMALLLAAAMGALYLSARHRGRIALP